MIRCLLIPLLLGLGPVSAQTGDWPLQLSDEERAALEARYGCQGGAMVAGECVQEHDGTSVRVHSADDLAALPLLSNLESVRFERDLKFATLTDQHWQGLASLPGLQHVNLSGTDITDLQRLTSLKGLKWLQISNTSISDLTPIVGLQALDVLRCDETAITDISPLAALPNLRVVSFYNTRLRSIAPLDAAKKLVSLDLGFTYVKDIEVLSDLPHLERLNLAYTPVGNFAPLTDLPSLMNLTLPNGTRYQSREAVAAFQKTLRGE